MHLLITVSLTTPFTTCPSACSAYTRTDLIDAVNRNTAFIVVVILDKSVPRCTPSSTSAILTMHLLIFLSGVHCNFRQANLTLHLQLIPLLYIQLIFVVVALQPTTYYKRLRNIIMSVSCLATYIYKYCQTFTDAHPGA
jgi:hypothetical protein